MQDTVKVNRNRYLGGSDIPILMGISPFKKRWTLLQEKAGIIKDEFEGNEFTEYGNKMEGKIRDFINAEYCPDDPFVEGCHTMEHDPIGFREHTDGENALAVLEIKTTGGNVDHEVYLVQLLWYMHQCGRGYGCLAIYHRPDDMSEEFDPERLELINVIASKNHDLYLKIFDEIDRFMGDLLLLKDNPFLSEEDLLPKELVDVAKNVAVMEQRLAELKEEEGRIKADKQKLFDAMMKSNVKSWRTINGVLVTRVDPIAPSVKEVVVFNEEKFKAEHAELYGEYREIVQKKSSGRAGYVRITLPKEAD